MSPYSYGSIIYTHILCIDDRDASFLSFTKPILFINITIYTYYIVPIYTVGRREWQNTGSGNRYTCVYRGIYPFCLNWRCDGKRTSEKETMWIIIIWEFKRNPVTSQRCKRHPLQQMFLVVSLMKSMLYHVYIYISALEIFHILFFYLI